MKLFSNFNFILLLLKIFPIIFSSTKGIITIPFEKQIPDLSNITPDEIIYKGLQKNNIYTNI